MVRKEWKGKKGMEEEMKNSRETPRNHNSTDFWICQVSAKSTQVMEHAALKFRNNCPDGARVYHHRISYFLIGFAVN